MNFSVRPVSRIFQSYRTQERIGELNRQANIKTVQTQRDRVDISPKARELLQQQTAPTLSFELKLPEEVPPQPVSTESTPNASQDETVGEDDFLSTFFEDED